MRRKLIVIHFVCYFVIQSIEEGLYRNCESSDNIAEGAGQKDIIYGICAVLT